VSVIGPQHQLAGLEARVAVDLSNWKTNFQADEKVGLYDTTGQRLGNFGAAPGTVQVSITVTAVITSRASAVLPKVSGTVAPGHQLASVTVSSPTVVLSGLPSLRDYPVQPELRRMWIRFAERRFVDGSNQRHRRV
jgi:YbbR domain-containing protein